MPLISQRYFEEVVKYRNKILLSQNFAADRKSNLSGPNWPC